MIRAGTWAKAGACRRWAILFVCLVLAAPACGYRIRSAAGRLPSGVLSLGIPTFENRTSRFRLEQQITGAVLKEFSIRTGIPVNSARSGVDAVLLGEIRDVSSSPVTFGSDTFGSVFLVTVHMGVRLVRVKDSKVLWENNDFLYRERFQLNSNVKDFFSEEGPALERLARQFAASLASAVMNQ